MPFKDGVKINKGFPIRAADLQIKMDAGRPGFFGFFDRDDLIDQYLDSLLVLLDLALDQHGPVHHQQVPGPGKHPRKNDYLYRTVHILNVHKGHQIPFFGMDGLGTLDKPANADHTPVF